MGTSATSTTKPEPGTLATYASLRFMGNRLEPDRLTELIGEQPTTSYRKGEVYRRSRGHEVRGRTGLWLLSSKPRVASLELRDHLEYLIALLCPPADRNLMERLQQLMRDDELEADVGCFWHGEAGARAPVVPEAISAAFARLPAEIVLDFDTD